MGVIHFGEFKNAYIPQIMQEVYINKVYEPYLGGRRDLTIVDVGANLGIVSLYFSDYARQVYAVEPAAVHYDNLLKNIEGNGKKNIIPVKKAISHKNGTEKFYHNANTTMYSLNPAVNNLNESEEVETITLDSFFAQEKIEHVDLMKLDTEGFEAEIVGSEGFSKVADKIDVIVGEWHSWSKIGPNIMISCLKDHGYQFSWVQGVEASVFVAKRI